MVETLLRYPTVDPTGSQMVKIYVTLPAEEGFALHWAKLNGHEQVAQLLEKHLASK